MSTFSKTLSIMVVILLLCSLPCALAENAAPYASLVFEKASVSITRSMNADFTAGMNCNCTSIYVASCSLEKRNANGTWSFVTSLTPPSDTASNASNFGAYKNYSGSCTSGTTYRIKATFAAIYNGKTYTVNRTSNSVAYQ